MLKLVLYQLLSKATGLQGTWAQYTTARKHLQACQLKTGMRMCFPMTETQIMTLIGYLFDRGLQGKTVSKTLSALRTLHLVEGHPSPSLRTELVSAVLKGKANFDEEEHRSHPKRQPVTLKVMRLLQITLRLNKLFSEAHKVLIFSIACIAFNGAFRLLCTCIITLDIYRCSALTCYLVSFQFT